MNSNLRLKTAGQCYITADIWFVMLVRFYMMHESIDVYKRDHVRKVYIGINLEKNGFNTDNVWYVFHFRCLVLCSERINSRGRQYYQHSAPILNKVIFPMEIFLNN